MVKKMLKGKVPYQRNSRGEFCGSSRDWIIVQLLECIDSVLRRSAMVITLYTVITS